MADIKQAIEFARQNPNSIFSTELRRRIESGQMKAELETAGLKMPQQLKERTGQTGLKGFATGVAQEELKFLGKMGSKIGRGILGGVEKLTGLPVKPKPTIYEEDPRGILEAKTTAEKAGQFTTGVAEFALPGGAITKAGKVAGAVAGATKLGKIGGLAARAGTEAIGFGGISAIKTGEVGTEARDTAIISALFPVAGAVSQAVKNSNITSNVAKRLVNSLIRPSLRVESYGKDPGLGVAKEGIVAKSFSDLAQKISKIRTTIFGNIESVANKSTKTVNLTGFLSPIDDALLKAQKTPKTNATLITRLNEVRDDLLGLTKDIDIKNASVKKAVDIKRTIGDITKFTGNASDDGLVNKPLKMIYGKVKGGINLAEPELKTLNERYANLTSAEIATKYREIIAGRQNIIGLTTQQFGIGTALAAALTTGGAITPTLIFGAGAAGLKSALSTPLAKTAFASFLAKATKEQKMELIKKAPWIKGIILETYLDIRE